jgi:hypothetical protein
MSLFIFNERVMNYRIVLSCGGLVQQLDFNATFQFPFVFNSSYTMSQMLISSHEKRDVSNLAQRSFRTRSHLFIAFSSAYFSCLLSVIGSRLKL